MRIKRLAALGVALCALSAWGQNNTVDEVIWLVGDDPAKNRWLVFCSAGTGFNDFDKPSKLSAEARIGGGYRISLNRVAKLDFLAGFQETYTHPLAYESDAGDYVPAERLRRNEAWFGALTFGLALVF